MIQYQATIVDAKQLTLPVTVNDVRSENSTNPNQLPIITQSFKSNGGIKPFPA
ncbi:hypothetical protein BRADI_3g07432v3 [Brachypodium distachyon]|uniref:Uncharacterized protein n=1 Tax=Brachypodium distachyon TaxID=15368 RepID=A0A2K2CVR7_BRADI|nr:hypothetical protein BRADI_3g07432v3 [Brachypodium distachyon]